MKKVLKVLGIIAIILIIFAVVIGVAVFNLIKDGGVQSNRQASEEEIAEAVNQMGDGILDGGFYLDGKVYQLPVTIADLSEGGWVFDDALKEQFPEFPAHAVTNNINIDNANDTQKALSIVLCNLSEETKTLEEVNIAQISMGEFTANKVILPQGITLDSTMDEAIAAYGEPADKSERGSEMCLTYENGTWKIALYFENKEDGTGTMTSVNYRLIY